MKDSAKKTKKKSAKDISRQKNFHRKWVTFLRMIRYGVNNFSRNVWLTIAATAVMTITLLFIFASVVLRNVLIDNISVLKDNVSMSIYLKNESTEAQASEVSSQLVQLTSVKSVEYVSSVKARENFINQNSSDATTLNALNQASNKFPATLHIKVVNINDTSQLEEFSKNNSVLLKYIDSSRQPSFAGPRKSAIENIGNVVTFAEKAGAAASVAFIFISSLIIFNTIQMAIYTRKEEIEMMKLIGADKSFIRGPFVVEAVFYGFIAAILATSLGYGLLYYFKDTLSSYISVDSTLNILIANAALVVLGMILLGAIIGTVSSLLATRRHLKV
jgi:cell division transport system permease protein